MTLLMGAVAYDPKVVTIWSGFRDWLVRNGLPFDFLLYSNYERQAEDLVAGRIHAAWNSPLAWVRARRLAAASGGSVYPLVMRDTDRDLRSVVVVRADSPVTAVADLKGRVVGAGAVDSPQATLLPLHHLREQDVEFEVRRFEVGVGLHGDHRGGERDAAPALLPGEVGAAPADLIGEFGRLLTGMSYADPEVRPLLDLEGLRSWTPGRTIGYEALEAAVDAGGFYDAFGRITAADYRP